MEERVAGIEPAQRRQDRQCMIAKLRARSWKKFGDWSNATGANQSVDLNPKRNEGDQENQTDRAKKPSPGNEVSRWPNIVTPQKPRDGGSCFSIRRDRSVESFRDRGESGKVIVTPDQPLLRRSTS